MLSSLGKIAKGFHEFFLNILGKIAKPVINIDWNLILGESSTNLSNLIRYFTLEEIKQSMFSFEGNKAPGSDGFSFSFFQTYWSIVGEDLLVLLDDFYHDWLDLDRINYSFVLLIPKKVGEMTMRDFRLISLLNNLCKVIAKILLLRFSYFKSRWTRLSSFLFMVAVWQCTFSMHLRCWLFVKD